MKTWQKTALVLSGLGLVGVILPRYWWFRRVALPVEVKNLPSTERELTVGEPPPDLAIAHVQHGHPRLVVVAHGFLKSMSHRDIARLIETLARRFDVLAFDFPGHGQSAGVADFHYGTQAGHLQRVLAYAHTLGYQKIALVGYSMGAAAALLAVAQGAAVDALVVISVPGKPPLRGRGMGQLPTWPWRWWARAMGTRLAPSLALGEWPGLYVDKVAPTPLLIVHDGLDNLVKREDSETLFAVARPPKDYLYIPGALHAAPLASVDQIGAWLERKLPLQA